MRGLDANRGESGQRKSQNSDDSQHTEEHYLHETSLAGRQPTQGARGLPHRTVPSSSSKLPGTTAPAAASAAFLACADSASPPLLAPACPNCTSDLNSLAQVPLQGRVGGGRRLGRQT